MVLKASFYLIFELFYNKLKKGGINRGVGNSVVEQTRPKWARSSVGRAAPPYFLGP
jgi:hypothetical protein